MKSKLLVASALFLAGCQLSNTTVDTSQPEQNQPADAATTQTGSNATAKQTDAVSKPVVKALTPQQQENVWDRITMQLSLEVPDEDRVEYYRKWYLRHPTHLKTVAERAEPFLFLITEKVEERGFPLELAMLPIVESSFDQFAYSHGRAAGLWQITPPTGRTFGLEQNWWYDGRRDVVKSTDAALDLLDYLQKKFDGDWLHALAAYNTGEGRVFRAIRNNKAEGKSTEFWALKLPRETSDYVPKLLAVADVISNADEYGIEIPAIANKQVVELVEPGVQMDIGLAAKYAGMDVKALQRLNPAYNQWATAPSGTNHFLLPLENAARFNEQFTANNNQGMNLIRYEIQPGDTLSQLAEKHNTRTDLIMKANNMESTALRAGRHLMIPVAMQDGSALASARTTQQTSHGTGHRVEYVIQSGDSLWTIARKHGVSIDQITRWNGISRNTTLRAGKTLTLWQKGSAASQQASNSEGIIRTISYSVRSGDSLSTIASRYKVRVSDLVKWNNLDTSKYLRPGQKLTLHIDVTKVSA
ncbi:LysM peptidoglycan-binding domain-containing protein [Thaumasiovibrio subtropicus]|uniref:LysM peptidoglycan-binding domain-containing protein n=1 Tax=Thaumasiovibrio subtropicus TaxID=1891207 RepID=UPI000B352FB0|nr:LysM peptidoglycan-binding domain-containing protein [Thaumasiovibrio subtropicus]